MELLKSYDLSHVRELQYTKNSVIHEGRIPSKSEAKWAIEIATRVIEELTRTR